MNDVRCEIETMEPAADVEFVQVLQDMIGDLTSDPEPVVIKLFSQDPQLLLQEPRRASPTLIGKVPGVVDVLNGMENYHQRPGDNLSGEFRNRGALRLHAGGNCRRRLGDSGR